MSERDEVRESHARAARRPLACRARAPALLRKHSRRCAGRIDVSGGGGGDGGSGGGGGGEEAGDQSAGRKRSRLTETRAQARSMAELENAHAH